MKVTMSLVRPPRLINSLLVWLPLALSQSLGYGQASWQTLLDRAGIPGLAVAAVNNQGITWARGFGHRQQHQPARVDTQTVFSAASLGKPVFAYLVLKLVDQGKLDLDKPLHEYVPYRAIEHDIRYQRITARMVLSHQTGFPNWRQGRLNLQFTPGQRFSYSGEGFVYLQGVVMTITGQDIDQLAQQYVFTPLAMPHSSFRWQPGFEANYATPHNRFSQPTPLARFAESNVAYSLQTTAADYGRFLVALLRGNELQPATRAAFFSAESIPGSTLRDTTQASASIRWGLGIGLSQRPNGLISWHWGDNGDFRGFACLSLAQQRGYVYFTNSRNGLSILSAVAKRLLGEPLPTVTAFLGYDGYTSPLIQVSRRLIRGDLRTVVTPYLPARDAHRSTPRNAYLQEAELLSLADELLAAAQYERAVQLLSLGRLHYPPSVALSKAYWSACLQAGKRGQALSGLRAYLALVPGDSSAHQLVEQLRQPPRGNVTLHLKGFGQARLITLAGSFNGWQPLHTLCQRETGGWRCQLELPKGHYTYQFIVDGHWQTDPANPVTEADGNGHINSVLEVGGQ